MRNKIQCKNCELHIEKPMRSGKYKYYCRLLNTEITPTFINGNADKECPKKEWRNDSIKDIPIMYKDVPIGFAQQYDGRAIQCVLWEKFINKELIQNAELKNYNVNAFIIDENNPLLFLPDEELSSIKTSGIKPLKEKHKIKLGFVDKDINDSDNENNKDEVGEVI